MRQRAKVSSLTTALVALISSLSLPAFAADSTSKSELLAFDRQDEQSGEQRLSFKFTGSKPTIRSFQLANPRRLVIDFLGAVDRSSAAALQSQSIELIGDETRLRAVIPLREDAQVLDSWDGLNYVLMLSSKTAAPAMPSTAMPAPPVAPSVTPTTSVASGSAATKDQDILKVDFRKGKIAGSGRLVVDLSNSNTPIDIKSQKGGLLIDFMGTNLPAHLAKRFDVADQMTPVSSMEFVQMADRTRVLLRAQGKWEHSAYQVENRFVFEIKPVFHETLSRDKVEGTPYKGDRLTLNFQNIEVRTLLQVLAEFSGLNIITSDSVGGNITLRLKEVPWDQALDLILQARGLDKRQNGNVLWIAPQDEIRLKEKKDADFRNERAQSQTLVTESFNLSYAKAAEMAQLLANPTQRILSQRGSAVTDARTNTVFVQDIPERIEAARAMIKKVDVPVKQVMIEARIVEATDTFGKSLGVRLGYNDGSKSGTPIGGTGINAVVGGGLAASTTTVGSGASFNNSYFVNMPSSGSAGNAPGTLSFILFDNAATRFLNLELSALVSDGKGQILSNPRVVTADKQEASIEQGTQIPYQQASSSGATSVSFKSATLALKVKPQITPDGNVLMDLKVNKDSVGANTTAGPAIDTKSITTQVLVEDGGTVVVGGIYTQDDTVAESRVPFFGDLPYIGFLFKTRNTTRERREMLVFITPKIVADRSLGDDLDAATVRQQTIKPILMSPDLVNSDGRNLAFPKLPQDKD